MFLNMTFANMMCGLIYINGKIESVVYGHWVYERPQTFVAWFLLTFGLLKCNRVVRYRIQPLSKHRLIALFTHPNRTFNSAATYIVNMLEKYPKGTRFGYSWNTYDRVKPICEIEYKTVYDARSIAAPLLIGLRDVFTDAKMTRFEQGDETLDNVMMTEPQSFGYISRLSIRE